MQGQGPSCSQKSLNNSCVENPTVSLKVQWESKEPNNQFQPYPAEINTKLETAFNNKEQIVEWMEEEADGKITKWTIDLKTNKETDGQITKEVHRRIIAEKGLKIFCLSERSL